MQPLPPAADRGSTRTATLLDVGLLLLPFLLVWLALADLNGWPHDDDHMYSRSVQWVVEEGRFQLARQKGTISPSLLSHLAVGTAVCGVTGFSHRSLFLACLLQQWGGAAAIYGIGRTLALGRAWSLLLGLALALNPWYFDYAFTFMSDGPAAAWGAVACFAAVRGFVTARLRWLFFCSAAVSWGFWTRQTNLVHIGAPLATLAVITLWRRNPFRAVPGAVNLLALPAASFLLMESGWLVHDDLERIGVVTWKEAGAPQLRQMALSAYRMILILGTVGWPLLPVLWSAVRQQLPKCSLKERRCCLIVSVLVTGLAATPFLATRGRACLTTSTGTAIQNAHIGPVLLADQFEPGRWGDLGGVAWPTIVWQVLTVCSFCVVGLLVWWLTWLLLRWRSLFDEFQALPLLALSFVGAGSVGAAFYVGIMSITFDRYWLLLFPILLTWLALIARLCDLKLPRAALAATSVVFAVLYAGNVIFVHDHLAWNNQRWQQVHAWLAEGVPVTDIDGGTEVNGWFRLAEDPYSRDREGDNSLWWSGFATRCIAVGPRPGWIETGRLSWTSWATGRQHHLLILRKVDAADH